MNTNGYTPRPVDTSDVELPDDLLALSEAMARNVHEVWAQTRLQQGWTYGPLRDDTKKEHPCLVPFDQLPPEEIEYDVNTSLSTLRLICKLGFRISKE